MKAGPLDVVVQFHEPLSLDQMNRKELAQAAERQIRAGQALALAGLALMIPAFPFPIWSLPQSGPHIEIYPRCDPITRP